MAKHPKVFLGKYVALKPRVDGSSRVYFQVPSRLRPADWPGTVTLLQGRSLPKSGAISKRDQLELQEASRVLLAEMRGEKPKRLISQLTPPGRARSISTPASAAKRRRSLKAVVEFWQSTSAWREITEKTRDSYRYGIRRIEEWARTERGLDLAKLTRADVQNFLARFDDRPNSRRVVAGVMRQVMEQVISLGWRQDNPAIGIRLRRPEPQILIWEQEDVDLYVRVARAQGMESLALIILLQWEIGQRLNDVRQFRPGIDYDAMRGAFAFRQRKTSSPVVVFISSPLSQAINNSLEDDQAMFRHEGTGAAYSENLLSKTFRKLRVAVSTAAVQPLLEGFTGDAGARALEETRLATREALKRPLVLRHLRHSCIVQLARAGCTEPEIASVTGHSFEQLKTILAAYLPKDPTVALNAQKKRGLVKPEASLGDPPSAPSWFGFKTPAGEDWEVAPC